MGAGPKKTQALQWRRKNETGTQRNSTAEKTRENKKGILEVRVNDIDKNLREHQRTASYLLPPPGDVVARQLLDELDAKDRVIRWFARCFAMMKFCTPKPAEEQSAEIIQTAEAGAQKVEQEGEVQ